MTNPVAFDPKRPFYYEAQETEQFQPAFGCYYAPSGWYQWTESGLKFLGPSILHNTK